MVRGRRTVFVVFISVMAGVLSTVTVVYALQNILGTK